MKKEISKIVALLIIIALNYAGLSAVGTTLAFFGDTETSEGNTFTAGVLDISASPDFFSQEIAEQVIEIPLTIDHTLTTVSGQYKMIIAEGDPSEHSFCLALTADLRDGNNDSLYSGSLLDLNSATTTMSIAPGESYLLRVSTSSPIAKELNGKKCTFEIKVVAWQATVENPTDGGFTDTEIISGEIIANVSSNDSGVVLNEFLPNPKGDDFADRPNGEWVELYNNSDTAKDLSGWYIRDNLDDANHKILIDLTHTGLTDQIIGAKGWLVVYMNKSLLNNSEGDSVRLFDSNDVLVDSYTYVLPMEFCVLKPTPGEVNDETGNGGGGGCASDVKEDKSYARIPDGVGEWVDPVPTPGEPNISEESQDMITESVMENVDTVIETPTEEILPSEMEETIVSEIIEEIPPAIEPETIEEAITEVLVENAPDDGLIWTDAVQEMPADVVAIAEVLPVLDEVIQ